jgi:hypothetical protein
MTQQIFFNNEPDSENNPIKNFLEKLDKKEKNKLLSTLLEDYEHDIDRIDYNHIHKASESEKKHLNRPISTIPLMCIPGFDIEPFIPSALWINLTIMSFWEFRPSFLEAGNYSFSLDVTCIYRILNEGFNFGLKLGEIIDFSANKANWKIKEELIDGIPVVSAYFEEIEYIEQFFPIEGKMCRAVYLRPKANTYYLNLLWFAKDNLIKAVYDHNHNTWIG